MVSSNTAVHQRDRQIQARQAGRQAGGSGIWLGQAMNGRSWAGVDVESTTALPYHSTVSSPLSCRLLFTTASAHTSPTTLRAMMFSSQLCSEERRSPVVHLLLRESSASARNKGRTNEQ